MNSWLRISGLVLFTYQTFWLGSRATAQEAARDNPVMQVNSIQEDFTVTGEGRNPAWNAANWVSLNRRSESAHDYQCRVKALYSKTGLYFLLDATDKQLTATMQEDNMNLWTEDVFEVFLWPNEAAPVYFEYEISPLGKELPIIVPNFDGQFFGWLPWQYAGARKTQKAVHIVGGEAKTGAANSGWQAELYFPYDLLKPLKNIPPVPGSKWRANFYRMDYDGGKKSSWDWARVGPSFHEYQKFGTLEFR